MVLPITTLTLVHIYNCFRDFVSGDKKIKNFNTERLKRREVEESMSCNYKNLDPIRTKQLNAIKRKGKKICNDDVEADTLKKQSPIRCLKDLN